MEHLLLKAATTATDEGVFEAVISTPTPDRDKDIVEPQAMVNALQKWAALGKLVPLAWAHTEEIVGSVDPSSVRVENGEVIVKGQIDQSTPTGGSETWRLVKSGTLSFSFGYLIPKGGATKQPGGRFRIKELDVFEISVVPVGPANNDTRVLSFKDAEATLRSAARCDAQIPELPPASEAAAEERPDELHERPASPRQKEDLSRKAAASRFATNRNARTGRRIADPGAPARTGHPGSGRARRTQRTSGGQGPARHGRDGP
jgi:HK97 family phage prohead protease